LPRPEKSLGFTNKPAEKRKNFFEKKNFGKYKRKRAAKPGMDKSREFQPTPQERDLE